MQLKWRDRSRAKVIIEYVKESIVPGTDGVSFNGFAMSENQSALLSSITFPEGLSAPTKSVLVRNALFKAAREDLNAESFFAALVSEYSEFLATRPKSFTLVTSMSVNYFGLSQLTIKNAVITFYEKGLPKEIREAREAVFKSRRLTASKGYLYVGVNVEARNENEAADLALQALNTMRAVMCLMLNKRLVFTSGEIVPINRFRLGRFHTLHGTDGNASDSSYWYDPNFTEAKVQKVRPDEMKVLNRSLKHVSESLTDHPLRSGLIKNLVRFVNAFDLVDRNTCILVGWACLESLVTFQRESGGDTIVRRLSFLYSDPQYQRQILEHIRIYRNSSVHEGEDDDESSTTCYQIQRYMWQLVRFYFGYGRKFANKEEMVSFLDLPPDLDRLKRKRKILNLAIKYRAPSPPANQT